MDGRLPKLWRKLQKGHRRARGKLQGSYKLGAPEHWPPQPGAPERERVHVGSAHGLSEWVFNDLKKELRIGVNLGFSKHVENEQTL